MQRYHFYITLISIILFSSCSTIQSWGIRSSSNIFESAEQALYHEGHLDYFTNALPGSLMTLEAFWGIDKSNETLTRSLVKGHTALAFGHYETLYLNDSLLDSEQTPWRTRALLSYQKALAIADQYLASKDLTRSEWNKYFNAPADLKKILEEEFDEEDWPTLFYMAQAWGGLINLQRNNTGLALQLPIVKTLVDFVCEKQPDFEWGNCQLFNAIYYASRPKALGGNPDKAGEIFKQLQKQYPQNLLISVSEVQYLLIPYEREKSFKQKMKTLSKQFQSFEQQLINPISKGQFTKQPSLNLFNAIALSRFTVIERLSKELF
jgi:hypothetical protein